MKSLLYIVAASFSLFAGACGSSAASSDADTRPVVEPIDSPSYKLGYQHGQDLLQQCRTENEIRDRFLDLRARHHIISSQIGQSAGRAYELGVEQAVIDSGDTLANIF